MWAVEGVKAAKEVRGGTSFQIHQSQITCETVLFSSVFQCGSVQLSTFSLALSMT